MINTLHKLFATFKSDGSQFSSVFLKRIALGLLAAALPAAAHAGDYKVYGSQFAWNNDFNAGGGIGASFGSGSSPNLTAWFNYGSTNLYGYPACVRGYHYGWNPTGDTLFPFQLTSKSSIPCSFSYSQGGSNMRGDFAYDMFLRWDSAKGNPQTEVMVWGDHNSWPIGNCTATYAVYTANRWFDLWEGYNSAAGYYVYTFVPTGSVKWPEGTLPGSGSLNVDMKVFFDWLANNRTGSNFNNGMYLDVIEAGFEVVMGNGWVWVQGDFNANTGGGGGGSVANGTYKIISRNSGKSMDCYNQNTGNGTQIQQWDYWGGNGQQWTVTDLGSGNHKIIGVQSGKSLDVDYSSGGTANGTKVQLWDYWNGPGQCFTFTATDSGNYRITPNCATGSCLDVDGVSKNNGAKVQLWQWNGGSNQQWSFQTP